MLKYTKASVNMLIDDCKKAAKVFKYVSLIFTIVFLSYQIVTGFINPGSPVTLITNIVLLATFVLSTCVEFVLDKTEHLDAKKIVTTIYKWFKILIKAFTLALTILEIANAPEANGIQIILATLMILLWIASFASQIILQVVTARTEIILIAFKQDVDDIKRPFTAVSNTFKRLTGKEVVVDEPNAKKRKILDKLNERIAKDKIKDEDDDE